MVARSRTQQSDPLPIKPVRRQSGEQMVEEPTTDQELQADKSAPSVEAFADPIRVGVLTVSDRCSSGTREDLSGPAIQSELPEDEYLVALYAVVPDDRKKISTTLKRWADHFHCDVIITTGGTGCAPRDVTPEATRKVIDREAPNISQYLLMQGVGSNPLAALSRGIAGLRDRTLIVNLPGSPAAAKECTIWLRAILPHAVSVIRECKDIHDQPAAE